MFDLGMWEIVLIAIIALVVMGPEKFPEFAKIALRAFRDLRGYIDEVKHEVANEIKPVQTEMRQLTKHNPEAFIEKLNGVLTVDVTPVDEADEPQTPTDPDDAMDVYDQQPPHDDTPSRENNIP